MNTPQGLELVHTWSAFLLLPCFLLSVRNVQETERGKKVRSGVVCRAVLLMTNAIRLLCERSGFACQMRIASLPGGIVYSRQYLLFANTLLYRRLVAALSYSVWFAENLCLCAHRRWPYPALCNESTPRFYAVDTYTIVRGGSSNLRAWSSSGCAGRPTPVATILFRAVYKEAGGRV